MQFDEGEPGEVRTPDRTVALETLRDAELRSWEQLCVENDQSYFAGPVWCTSWYESFGDGRRTEVGIWTDSAGALAGIVPMVQVRERLAPGRLGAYLRTPCWQNLGAGAGGADHGGFGCVPELRGAAIHWAIDRPGSVRLLGLDPSWGAQLALIGGARSVTGTWSVSIEGQPRPGSKKLWKHITRSRRQLVDRGVELDVVVGSEISRSLLEELFSLHGIRSESVGRRTTFTTSRLDFHGTLAARSTDAHSSFLVRARVQGRMVGALYGFMDHSRVYYFQSGWDPEYQKASLGSILIGDAVELASARSATTFDFLRGDEPYKLRFGAHAESDLSATVARGVSGVLIRSRDAAAAYQQARRFRTASSASSGPSASGKGNETATDSEQS